MEVSKEMAKTLALFLTCCFVAYGSSNFSSWSENSSVTSTIISSNTSFSTLESSSFILASLESVSLTPVFQSISSSDSGLSFSSISTSTFQSSVPQLSSTLLLYLFSTHVFVVPSSSLPLSLLNTPMVTLRTQSNFPTSTVVSNLKVSSVIGGVIGSSIGFLLLLLIIAATLIVLCRRRSSKVTLHANIDDDEELGEKHHGSDDAGVTVGSDIPLLQRYSKIIAMEEFPSHVRALHQNANRGFEEEFSAIPAQPSGPYEISKLPCNMDKNRFENIFPYDSSRVILSTIQGKEGSDYINASYIDGYNKPKGYIAAQGPLHETIGDFWRMMWEYRLPTIVMLTELSEGGRPKCERYWPESINMAWDVGYGFKVSLIEQRPYAEYTIKILSVANVSQPDAAPLQVTHFHFTVWPDHGVPADKTCMIQFIKRVRNTHLYRGPPLVVHCSAGVGRSGTFIVLDSMLEKMKCERSLNVFEFVCQLRKNRVLMVQTEMQYSFIHDALEEYITCGDTSVLVANMRATIMRLSKEGFEAQFKLLDEVSYKPVSQSYNEGQAEYNQGKNRYTDKLPLNMTRVRLRPTGIKGADYINATFVDGYKSRRACIATQGPLECTVVDLWRMAWECQSRVIVLLCNLVESEKESSCIYWPSEVGKQEVFGKLKVKLLSEENMKDYTIRKMELSADCANGATDTVLITQFHCTTWPEYGKPTTSCILKIMDSLVKAQIASGNHTIIVMCNNGLGRTGAFICIYAQLERIKTEGIADIFQYIKSARLQCPGLLLTMEQYVLCHEVIAEYIDTFDNYANFKELS